MVTLRDIAIFAVLRNVPPSKLSTLPDVPRLFVLDICNTPPLIAVPPVELLAPLRISVPRSSFTSVPVPVKPVLTVAVIPAPAAVPSPTRKMSCPALRVIGLPVTV